MNKVEYKPYKTIVCTAKIISIFVFEDMVKLNSSTQHVITNSSNGS